MQADEQLELHTDEYRAAKKKILSTLFGSMRGRILWDGEVQSCRGVLVMILHNTPKGQRFVREASGIEL